MTSSVQYKLRIVSYNCHGWSNGKSFVPKLLQDRDFLLIQEHWLADCQIHLLSFDGFSTLFLVLIAQRFYMDILMVVVQLFIGNLWQVWLSMSELKIQHSVQLS